MTYLILTLKAEPITVRNRFHLRFEAVHVVSFVTAIAEKKLFFILATRAELATLFREIIRRFFQRLIHLLTALMIDLSQAMQDSKKLTRSAS